MVQPHSLIIPDATIKPSVSRTSGNDETAYESNTITNFPEFTGTQGATVDSVVVIVQLQNSSGSVSSNSNPGGISKVWDAGARTFTISGAMAGVNTVLQDMQYNSIVDEVGDISYTVKITDNDSETSTLCTNGELKLVSDELIKFYEQACSPTQTLTGTSGSFTISINDTLGSTVATISNSVPFNTDLDTTVNDLIIDIATVSTTPQFTATKGGTNEFIVCGPQGLGDIANGYVVIITTTGNIGITGDPILSGGITGTSFKDLLNEVGLGGDSLATRVVSTLIGQTLGAIINQSLSQIRIDIPNPIEPVRQIRVLWRGRNTIDISNDYDPVTKIYGGGWDFNTFGTPSYTNNPSWCLLDFIKNSSFGTAREIYDRMLPIQKTIFHNDIYIAAQRCDEIIGTTNRYTINALVTNKRSNLEIINDIAGVMHAQVLFLGSNVIRLIQDKPRNPVLLVNQSGVAIEGFSYATKSPKTTYNDVQISYYDPDKYSQLVTIQETFASFEVVRDSAVLNILAWGINNSEQAIRHSRKIAHDENSIIVTAKYLGALDHQNIIPGDVVRILDEWNETELNAFGGRITSVTSSTVFTVDRDLTITGNPLIYLTMPNGTFDTRTIDTVGGTGNRTVTVTVPTSDTSIIGAKFNITDGKDFIITKITRRDKGIYEIFGIPYDAGKYIAIDA